MKPLVHACREALVTRALVTVLVKAPLTSSPVARMVPVVLMSVSAPVPLQFMTNGAGGQLAAAHVTPMPLKVPPAAVQPAWVSWAQVPSHLQQAPGWGHWPVQVESVPWKTPPAVWQAVELPTLHVPSGMQQAPLVATT